MRGRKPTPSHLKLVSGNPGKRRVNKREPKPRRVIPAPPAHLSPRALVVWGQLTVVLDRMRLLTEADVLALERICETVAELDELKAAIAKHGRTQRVKTESGSFMIRVRPEISMYQVADQHLRMWLTEFGLTPSARARVHAEDDGGRNEDPLAKYFGA